MPQSDREKLNRVEELKGKLFSKNFKPQAEKRDRFTHFPQKEIPEAWERENIQEGSMSYADKFFMKTSLFKNFFIFSAVFFILALGYASYVFFAGGNNVSNENIDIAVLGNNFTAGGEELPLVIGITNRNSSALDLVDLVVEYPRGTSDSERGSVSGTERQRESLGTIPAGAVRNENLKVVLFGEQGTVRTIKISLEYRVEGSNAIFVKSKNYDVTISSTPLNLTVDAPLTVSPNQNIVLNIQASLNSPRPASKILLKVDYPAGFKFESSIPSPSLGNNVWSLGDLPAGAERSVAITGKMLDAVDGEEKVFHVRSGSQSSSDKSVIDVVFNSLAYTVGIEKPFIEAKLFINEAHQREYATNTNTPVRGEIRWVNNLDTKINDLEIRAKISGNAADRRTINAEQGFYDSSSDVIIWDKNSKIGFDEINPGDAGSVRFSVSPVPLLSAAGGLLSNPSMNVLVSIRGKQLVAGYSAVDLNNSESSIIRVITDVGFTAKAFYYSGAFVNAGPIPPRVEQETTYTVVWSISNTANNISGATVRSTLPQWIKFAGPISPAEENLNYNPSTREIAWNVGKVTRGAGITGPGRSVSFQISFKPSLSQVNTVPVIINEAVLTGHDDFANVDLRVSRTPLRTHLDADLKFPPAGGTVTE